MAVPEDIQEAYRREYGDYYPENIDDILSLEEPYRSVALDWFLNGYHDRPDVLIKTNDGRPMTVYLNKPGGGSREFNISPRFGKRVSRRDAVALIMAYGRNGQYYMTDQATGLHKQTWLSMKPKRREEEYGMYELNFLEQYLVHVPDREEEPEDAEEFAAD
jgi:hypothetical protein